MVNTLKRLSTECSAALGNQVGERVPSQTSDYRTARFILPHSSPTPASTSRSAFLPQRFHPTASPESCVVRSSRTQDLRPLRVQSTSSHPPAGPVLPATRSQWAQS